MVITSRLLPGVHIKDQDGLCEISLEPTGQHDNAGRAQWRYFIDLPDGTEHEDADVHGWADARGMTATLLNFLGACAESRQHATRTGANDKGENGNLFPDAVGEWAEQNSDEIGMLALELEETS